MSAESVQIQAASGSSGRQALDDETQALFDAGLGALERAETAAAIDALTAAHARAPGHAVLRSMLGVALARGEGAFEEARRHCEEAARQEFFNPDLYLNLARVYLCHGRRAEALRYLRRGQMIAPGHEPIRDLIASLGRRRLPIVPFLPRRHPVNRALGTARSRFFGAFSRA